MMYGVKNVYWYILIDMCYYECEKMKYVQNKPNVFSALGTLMILSFVVSLVALPNANIVQVADTQQSFSGSGQIASAHWVVGAVTWMFSLRSN